MRSRIRLRSRHDGGGGTPVSERGSAHGGGVAPGSVLTPDPQSPSPPVPQSGWSRRGRGWRRILAPALILTAAATACGGREEVPPHPISAASPFRYPVPEWDAGKEGDVVLMVHVTTMGVADTAFVYEESGEAAFDRAALAGVENLLFAPARRGDERVEAWVRLPVRFSMDGGPAATDALAPTAAEAPDTGASP